MKTKFLITLLLSAATPSLLPAQGGSLTPPAGPIGPVMKSLDLIETRIPLVAGAPGVTINSNGNIAISQSGSYFLTGNQTITTAAADGITVVANNVTIDLNGFSLICTGVNGGTAVNLGGYNGIRVHNGFIVGGTTVTESTFTPAGWNNGISGSGTDIRVGDLSIRGVRNNGLEASSATSVAERVHVNICGSIGIHASNVSDSTVKSAGYHGIFVGNGVRGGIVTNCVSESVGSISGSGISAQYSTVTNSRGFGIAAHGIHANEAFNSAGKSSSYPGLLAKRATNCDGESESGTGLWAEVANNCTGKSTSYYGLIAENALNCSGTSSSSYGLSSGQASNCTGLSVSGTGMYVNGTASFCRGTRIGGTAISATIAIGCTTGGGTITSSQKHLGTP